MSKFPPIILKISDYKICVKAPCMNDGILNFYQTTKLLRTVVWIDKMSKV